MQSLTRQAMVTRLRDVIEGMERRPALERPAHVRGPDIKDVDAVLRLDSDGLHEIWTPSCADAGAVLGFALGQGRMRISNRRPVLLFLALAQESRETGLPYGPGLKALGLDSSALILVRARSMGELLWAAEEAAGSAAVAGVVMENRLPQKALDFTAMRRLALRSGVSGTPVLVMRYGSGQEASSARTRWRIEPFVAAADPHDSKAAGAPRWRAVLEKAPRGQRGEWVLSWSGQHFVAEKNNDSIVQPAPSPSGAPLPLLGNRLAQAG